MKVARVVVLAILGLVVLAQLVPYGRGHANPAVLSGPPWDSQTTQDLARRACFDCHSNETRWPWYSHVAPVSWLVQRDVDEGREALNFSDLARAGKEAKEAADTVRKGEMPPWSYVALHPRARLDAEETEALARGLASTLGVGQPGKKADR